jgi:hypothetical protein
MSQDTLFGAETMSDGHPSEESLSEKQAKGFEQIGDVLEKDLILYRHDIDRIPGDYLRKIVDRRKSKHSHVGFVLVTRGGAPGDAYRIVRCLQHEYEHVTMYVFGECKSAGTLMVMGGDELAMSKWGELSPLDIQIRREDQMTRESGAVTEEAFSKMRQEAFMTLRKVFSEMLDFGNGRISIQTASEIGVKLTSGLFSPISSQIDPLKVGETSRHMSILLEYAERLSRMPHQQTQDAVAQLASGYSSHSFVIDRWEAVDLFGENFVRDLRYPENFLAGALGEVARYASMQPGQGAFERQIRYLDEAAPGLDVKPIPPIEPAFSFPPDEQSDGEDNTEYPSEQDQGASAQDPGEERAEDAASSRDREAPPGQQ